MADYPGSQKAKRVAILELDARGKNVTEIAAELAYSRNTVASAIKRGTADVAKNIRDKPVRTDELVEAVQATISEKNGKTTVYGLAREFAIPERTMGRLVKIFPSVYPKHILKISKPKAYTLLLLLILIGLISDAQSKTLTPVGVPKLSIPRLRIREFVLCQDGVCDSGRGPSPTGAGRSYLGPASGLPITCEALCCWPSELTVWHGF